MVKRIFVLTIVLVGIALAAVSLVNAEEWSGAYITALPDSAFAVIETTPHGKKVRHLPHHDRTGELDIPHLKSARARLGQVKWVDPANEAKARAHLEQHWQEYREFVERARHAR